MKEEGIVSMVISNGLFIMGKLIGGNKLTDPRVFSIIENGAKMQLSPLPATPPFVTVNADAIRYPIPLNELNKNILDLYDKVTHPPEKPIVMPEQPTVN